MTYFHSILPNDGRCTSQLHPTFSLRRRILLLLLLFLLLMNTPIQAQDAEPDPLRADETRVITLDGEGPAVLTFEAAGGEVISVFAHSLLPESEVPAERDLVLEILDESGGRLAYNDDHFTEREDLLPGDAAIERLSLSEAGRYQIRVNTYGGIFPGEVELTISAVDVYAARFEQVAPGLLQIEAILPRNTPYAYTFELGAGEILSISAQDTGYTLDPLIRLVDAAGDVIAFNDDHNSADLRLDAFDAKISDLPISEAGRYTLLVSDFLGRAGSFRLRIERR